jgi:hypothetical protein
MFAAVVAWLSVPTPPTDDGEAECLTHIASVWPAAYAHTTRFGRALYPLFMVVTNSS